MQAISFIAAGALVGDTYSCLGKQLELALDALTGLDGVVIEILQPAQLLGVF